MQEAHARRRRCGGRGMKRWREQKAVAGSVHRRAPVQASVTRLIILQQKSQVNTILPVVKSHCSSFTDHLYSPDPPHSDTSPASQKKVGGAGSMMDKLRSPGTGRKLSFKMKKLPELRRKLSLRSSSCAHRQGSREDRDESTNKNAVSSLALSNQNVISRYHLDSSTPPDRPMRQSSRGRSARKEGEQISSCPGYKSI